MFILNIIAVFQANIKRRLAIIRFSVYIKGSILEGKLYV